MHAIKKLAVLLSFFLVANSTFAETKLNVNEVLKKTEEVYAKCNTYTDTGYVRTTFMDENGKKTHVRKLIFSTSYIRPNKFRFEYGEKIAGELQNRYIIWKNGGKLKTFWELTGEEKPKSLSMALAGATGVSGGSAHTIPSLLIPKVGGRLITHIDNPVLLADNKDENGFVCYLIKSDANETLWIQKETFLISKIEESTEFDDFKTKSVTLYRPQVNIKIPEKFFLFQK